MEFLKNGKNKRKMTVFGLKTVILIEIRQFAILPSLG